MIRYNEIKDEPALRRMTDLARGRSISLTPWGDPEKRITVTQSVAEAPGKSMVRKRKVLPNSSYDREVFEEIQAILGEIGEPTIKEWAIALLEHAHNHSWDMGYGRTRKMHHTARIKDLRHLGDVLACWVKDQAEIRTPLEDPQYYKLPKDEDGAWIYPPEVLEKIQELGPIFRESLEREFEAREERKEENRSIAEHNRLRGPAQERARDALAKLTPEQERAWLFGRFYPYPGPYAGHGIELFAFGEAYLTQKEAENAEALEKFVAGLSPKQLTTWGIEEEWFLPPLELLTLGMRRKLFNLLLTPLTEALRESRVSFASLLRARFKQAVENGELSEETEE